MMRAGGWPGPRLAPRFVGARRLGFRAPNQENVLADPMRRFNPTDEGGGESRPAELAVTH
jgi:hypothetical protein